MVGEIGFFLCSNALARLGDHQLGVLLGQLLVLSVTRQSGFHRREFVVGNMTGVVLPVLPMLQLVIRPGRARTILKGVAGKLAPLHGRNGGDSLEKLLLSKAVAHMYLAS